MENLTGWTTADVAAHCEVSNRTVQRVAQAMGIARPRHSREPFTPAERAALIDAVRNRALREVTPAGEELRQAEPCAALGEEIAARLGIEIRTITRVARDLGLGTLTAGGRTHYTEEELVIIEEEAVARESIGSDMCPRKCPSYTRTERRDNIKVCPPCARLDDLARAGCWQEAAALEAEIMVRRGRGRPRCDKSAA
jgi:hypothetical protein